MLNGEKILSRLSVPGVTLLVLGAVLGFQAEKLCRLVLKEKADKVALPMRLLGLLMALLGALILLDVFPNF